MYSLHRLGKTGNGPKDLHDRNIIRAGIRALTAADTCRTHMGQPGQMEKQRVRGHFDDALSFGPLQILRWVVIEDVRAKDTFFAVADRACHPAVVAVDAIGKVCRQLFDTVDMLPCFFEHGISVGHAFC